LKLNALNPISKTKYTINRTILELKRCYLCKSWTPIISINRTILELKQHSEYSFEGSKYAINRTILELKQPLKIISAVICKYYQSNHFGIETAGQYNLILHDLNLSIEPFWNWNDKPFNGKFYFETTINRTILELKPSGCINNAGHISLLSIEPFWNWNNASQFLRVSRHDRYQSNHFGIETKWKYWFLM